jgi:hypothetical protein
VVPSEAVLKFEVLVRPNDTLDNVEMCEMSDEAEFLRKSVEGVEAAVGRRGERAGEGRLEWVREGRGRGATPGDAAGDSSGEAPVGRRGSGGGPAFVGRGGIAGFCVSGWARDSTAGR